MESGSVVPNTSTHLVERGVSVSTFLRHVYLKCSLTLSSVSVNSTLLVFVQMYLFRGPCTCDGHPRSLATPASRSPPCAAWHARYARAAAAHPPPVRVLLPLRLGYRLCALRAGPLTQAGGGGGRPVIPAGAGVAPASPPPPAHPARRQRTLRVAQPRASGEPWGGGCVRALASPHPPLCPSTGPLGDPLLVGLAPQSHLFLRRGAGGRWWWGWAGACT